MTQDITVTVHDIQDEGAPNPSEYGPRMAFIFDGNIVSGWPLRELNEDGLPYWEADSDVGRVGVKFDGVTHWIEFPDLPWRFAAAK